MKFEAADRWMRERLNMPTRLASEGLALLAPAIRAHAFFSARVADSHILARLRDVSDRFSHGKLDLASARLELKNWLGERPEPGSKEDRRMDNLASTARLNLILRQNARMAHAVGEWEQGNDPVCKEMFPYWRYIASTSESPRQGHLQYAGRVYRKDDPIWHRIFPPWDFNCKCSVEECDEEEAHEGHGLQKPTKPEDVPKVADSGFAFDPAEGMGVMDPALIQDEDFRKKTITALEKRYGAKYTTKGVLEAPKPTPEAKPARKPVVKADPKSQGLRDAMAASKDEIGRRVNEMLRDPQSNVKRNAMQKSDEFASLTREIADYTEKQYKKLREAHYQNPSAQTLHEMTSAEKVWEKCKESLRRANEEYIAKAAEVYKDLLGYFKTNTGEYLHVALEEITEQKIRDNAIKSIFEQMVSSSLLLNSNVMKIKQTLKERSFYSSATGYINLGEKSKLPVGIHEAMHWLEDKCPHVHKRCVEFLEYRCKGEKFESLCKITKNPKYEPNEKTRKDRFFSPYCGKDYRDMNGNISATEILSMGIQRILEVPTEFFSQDPEYFTFCMQLVGGWI